MTIFYGPTQTDQSRSILWGPKPSILPQWVPTPRSKYKFDETLTLRGIGTFRIKKVGRQGYFLYLNHEMIDGPFLSPKPAKDSARIEANKRV